MLLLLPLLFACCSPFTVDPIYRPNHYRAYFKRNWGMKQLEKLNSTRGRGESGVVNMEKVESLMNDTAVRFRLFKAAQGYYKFIAEELS